MPPPNAAVFGAAVAATALVGAVALRSWENFNSAAAANDSAASTAAAEAAMEQMRQREEAAARSKRVKGRTAFDSAGSHRQGLHYLISSLAQLRAAVAADAARQPFPPPFPFLPGGESEEAVVLAALLLWGCPTTLQDFFTPSFLFPDWRHVDQFGFALSTLSAPSAHAITRWLRTLSGQHLPCLHPDGFAGAHAANLADSFVAPHPDSFTLACLTPGDYLVSAGRVLPQQLVIHVITLLLAEEFADPNRHHAMVFPTSPCDFIPHAFAGSVTTIKKPGLELVLSRMFPKGLPGFPGVYIATLSELKINVQGSQAVFTSVNTRGQANSTISQDWLIVASWPVATYGMSVRVGGGGAMDWTSITRPSGCSAKPAAWDAARSHAATVYAELLVKRRAAELLARVSRPSHDLTGASLLHLTGIGGEPARVISNELIYHSLDVLRTHLDAYSVLFNESGGVQRLHNTLCAGLSRLLPSLAGGEWPTLMEEVQSFVSNTLSVCELKLLSTPLTAAGRTPADLVCDTSAQQESCRDLITSPLRPSPIALRSQLRSIETAALAALKARMTPPAWVGALLAVVLGVVTLLIAASTPAMLHVVADWAMAASPPQWSAAATRATSHLPMPFVTYAVSLCLAAWTVTSVVCVSCGITSVRDIPLLRAPLYDALLVVGGACCARSFSRPVATAEEGKRLSSECDLLLKGWGWRILEARLRSATAPGRSLSPDAVMALMDQIIAHAGPPTASTETDAGTREEWHFSSEQLPGLASFEDAEVVEAEEGETPPPPIAGVLQDLQTACAATVTTAVHAAIEERGAAALAAALGDAPSTTRAKGPPRGARRSHHSLSATFAAHAAPPEEQQALEQWIDAECDKEEGEATPALEDAAPPTTTRVNRGSSAPSWGRVPVPGSGSRGNGSRSMHKSVREVLKEGGWTLARQGKHLVYSRVVAGGKKQTFVSSKTPSSQKQWMAAKGTLARLEKAAQTGVKGE